MKKIQRLGVIVLALIGILGSVQNTSAEVINFDDLGLSGPSGFQYNTSDSLHIDISTGLGIVAFDGGVLLTNTTNLPANRTTLLGTSVFGGNMPKLLTITFPFSISGFSVDVYNGMTSYMDYRIYDNLGNSAIFNLASNTASGQTQIEFPTVGNVVFVESFSQPNTSWDFFIDNIQFDALLPNNIAEDVEPSPVPEPSTMLLLVTGLAGLAGYRLRRRSRC